MLHCNVFIQHIHSLFHTINHLNSTNTLNLTKRLIAFRPFHSSDYTIFSNLWLQRHKLEESELSDLLDNTASNDNLMPQTLHLLSVAHKFDSDKLKPQPQESRVLDILENFDPKKFSMCYLSHSLYFLAERGVCISESLHAKFSNYANNSSRVAVALALIKLTNDLTNSITPNVSDISDNLYNNEIQLNVTDLAYLNVISIVCLNNSALNAVLPAQMKLDANSTSFLKHVVLAHKFPLIPPSDQQITRERHEAKEAGIVSESLQIGAFYYTLVNVKLKEIYVRRQPNDYLDTECERLRPFVLWKEAYAKSNGFKLVQY
ncbi:hypothetical protein BMR1_03g01615 [Babesia microti strain RI]|uniref:Uncharacterized protein n=1 Tax=Babesia microti (strain RI) TaxID=1133968 RepID=A0A1R4ABP7_BABMR|nr:hypothetical protein BMR1_03g01615 [Babesia microti strain RI]SJK86364.1 hypothetical protein BMR1_03g01615 [Babesia microti strain RI]|eukprot:XP_021338528.1 hypothetical protein BMR1_03g01615 [Babesia microti strain RI]